MKKKLLSIAMAFMLVAVGVVGTLAYLKDTTGEVQNTFTVGKVKITLDEAELDLKDGALQFDDNNTALVKESRTEEGNDYQTVYPGFTYPKDPTVTVVANSEDCYVFIKVSTTKTAAQRLIKAFAAGSTDYPGAAETSAEELMTGYDPEKWIPVAESFKQTKITVNGEEVDGVEAVLRWHEVVKKSSDATKLDPVMTKIVVPADWEEEDMAGLADGTLNFIAYAIQAAGLDEDTAYAALFSE